MGIFRVPRGPVMAMEGVEAELPMAREPLCTGAGRMSKVTPGGMESGALPMFEGREVVVLKVRVVRGLRRREVRRGEVSVTMIAVASCCIDAGGRGCKVMYVRAALRLK